MSHDPKLEIYKLKIKDKNDGRNVTFRDFFRSKLNYNHLVQPYTREDIFKTYYNQFIKEIDKKGYNKNESKKKGFTIAKDEVKNSQPQTKISTPITKDDVISGNLKGGRYGVKRNLGVVDDTDDNQDITTKQIVGDEFYFLLYTPIDHNEGVLMIQGYTEVKISDIVRDYLLEFFKVDKQYRSQFELFVPKHLKDKYLNKATIKRIQFSSDWTIKGNFESIKYQEYDLEVKVEIVDKNKDPDKKTSYSALKDFFNFFRKSKIKMEGSEEKELSEFEKTKAKVTAKNGREIPIKLENNDITPVILLKSEGIEVGNDGIPDFEQIDMYCRKLLEDIKNETHSTNAVEEL